MNLTQKLKRLPWFEIIILIVLLAVNGYAAFSDAFNLPNTWFTRDDAYYYFKVAQNISEGHGSTFDSINSTNGYHPLWMLVNVPIFALARFDLILPLRILIILLAGLRAATSILLYRLLKQTLAHPIAILGALYWAFDNYIHVTAYQQGLETGLAAFVLVLFLYQLQRFERGRKTTAVHWKQIAFLAVCATFVMFSRLDMVFLAGVFGLWIVFRDRPIRYLLPLDIFLLTASATGAVIIRVGLPDYYTYSTMVLVMLGISLVLNISMFYGFGLYEHPKAHPLPHLLKQSGKAIGISTALILAFMFAITRFGLIQVSLPRTAPLIHGLLSFFLLVCIRLLIALFSSKHKVLAGSSSELFKQNWANWLREGSIFYGILGGSLGLYMLWSQITFGTSSPVSGQIKRWWGSFPSRVYGGAARSPLAFYGLDAESDFNAWNPITKMIAEWNNQTSWIQSLPIKYDQRYALILLLFLAALVGLLFINRKRSARISNQMLMLPLLVGAGLQILQYNITGYSAPKEWYWVSQMVFIPMAGCLLLDILTQKLRQISVVYVSLYALIIFWGTSSAISFFNLTTRQMPYGEKPANTPYMEVATFVETHTEPGSLVGMTGGGNVGYFIQDRTIVNMDGLINSYPYFQANKAGHGSDFLYEMGLDYIFANPDLLEGQPYRGQYTGRLEPIARWGGKAVMHFLQAP